MVADMKGIYGEPCFSLTTSQSCVAGKQKKKKKGLATSHIDGWILNKPATSQLLHAAMVQSGI